MASIADMEREDRLKSLWGSQVPKGANQANFGDYDPLQALAGLGSKPDPYLALKFLQLGHELGQMNVGPANDGGMLMQLINDFLQQSQKQGQKK